MEICVYLWKPGKCVVKLQVLVVNVTKNHGYKLIRLNTILKSFSLLRLRKQSCRVSISCIARLAVVSMSLYCSSCCRVSISLYCWSCCRVSMSLYCSSCCRVSISLYCWSCCRVSISLYCSSCCRVSISLYCSSCCRVSMSLYCSSYSCNLDFDRHKKHTYCKGPSKKHSRIVCCQRLGGF